MVGLQLWRLDGNVYYQFSLLEKLVGLQPELSPPAPQNKFSLLEKLVGLQQSHERARIIYKFSLLEKLVGLQLIDYHLFIIP